MNRPATVRLLTEEEAQGFVREYFKGVKERFGMDHVPSITRAMAYKGEWLKAHAPAYMTIMGTKKVDRATKEMIAVAVAAMDSCRY